MADRVRVSKDVTGGFSEKVIEERKSIPLFVSPYPAPRKNVGVQPILQDGF